MLLPVLRAATGLCFAAVTVAQYAFAYNIFRTARSGPMVGVLTPGALVAGSTR
jgi:hypothetical protein